MADNPYWEIEYDGTKYQWFGISSLTAGRLRAFKGFFGDEYGKANAFNQAFLSGDVDAVSCVVWALLKERAKNEPGFRFPDKPQLLDDFSVGDLVNQMYTELITRTADDPDPTEAPVEELSESTLSPILTSTSTLTSGEESSSVPSARSSASRRGK
jgi:hypothetical protein